MKGFLLYCFVMLQVCCQTLPALNSFEILQPNSELYKNYQQLLASSLGTKAALNPNLEKLDRYSIAIGLSQITQQLHQYNGNLYFANQPISIARSEIQNLIRLSENVSEELQLINLDPLETELRLQNYASSASQSINTSSKTTTTEDTTKQLKFDSVDLQNSLNNGDRMQTIQSYLNFSYKQHDKLQATIGLTGEGRISNSDSSSSNNAGIDIEQARIDWQPHRFANAVSAGKYQKPIGLGLSNHKAVKGIEARKFYQEHKLEVGFFDGLYTSITTPQLLDTPFTFYSMQKRSHTSDKNDLFHAGSYFERKLNPKLQLTTEFAQTWQSNQNSNGYQKSAFALKLDYEHHPKLKARTALAHVGENFKAYDNNDKAATIDFRNDNSSDAIQKEVLNSLSNFLGFRLNELAGYSNLKLQLDYLHSKQKSLQWHWDFAYDHTKSNINSSDGFHLSSVYYSHKLDAQKSLKIGLQSLFWQHKGNSRAVALGGRSKQNFHLFETAYQLKF